MATLTDDEIAELRAALQAAQQDTVRLNWMQANLLRRASMRFGMAFKEVNAWSVAADTADLREAIDKLSIAMTGKTKA